MICQFIKKQTKKKPWDLITLQKRPSIIIWLIVCNVNFNFKMHQSDNRQMPFKNWCMSIRYRDKLLEYLIPIP